MRNLFKLKNQGSQRGVAAVEFAIVLPVLLFLFIGITEFGIAYYNKQVITNASREGARAALNPSINEDEIKQTIRDYIVFLEDGQLKSRLITFGANPYLDNEDYKPLITVIPPDANNHRTVKVAFKYTYLILAGFKFFGANFENPLNISAQTVIESL